MNYLLKNGQILLSGELRIRDLLIVAGRIAAIGKNLVASGVKTVDLQHAFITPGLVDLHVHLRDPGMTAEETIATGSLAAAHGGFTFVGAMPNVLPVPDNAEKLSQLIQRQQTEGVVHIGQYATITQKRTSQYLVDFAQLKQAGALAFSNDGSGVQSARTMLQAMQAAQTVNLLIAAHVEAEELVQGGVINAGVTAKALNIPGIPEIAETAQLARDLVLAQATGVHYHMCHVSTAAAVQMIRCAKQAGVNVTCEVTPHHLLLSEQAICNDDGNFKMNPPLRTEHDRQALLQGLLDGTIDCIATDHAPHTIEEKQLGLKKAAFGIVGSETAFSLLYTHLVKTNLCTLAQLIEWLNQQPIKIFSLGLPTELAVGAPADLAIFDLTHPFKINAADFCSKSANTPFLGEKVYGKTLCTIVAGKIVYLADELKAAIMDE